MDSQSCVDMYGDLPFGMFSIPDASLRGKEGYIFTGDGVPIIEQNADFLRKKKFLKPRIGAEHKILRTSREVKTLVSLISRCDTGFFHWMMDSLPKVVIAEACGFMGSYLIPSPNKAPWAEESMRILGISPTRLIHHTSLDTRAHRLFIPTYFSGYNGHHNRPFLQLYRNKVREAIEVDRGNSKERILIARKPTTKTRRIVNGDEVQNTLERFGFTTIYFEDLSLREQLQRAISAEIIIAAHGSGLCHSLYMDEGSTVVELFPFRRERSCDCYETLSTIPEHRYYSLESERECHGDIIVPTDALRSVLTEALSE